MNLQSTICSKPIEEPLHANYSIVLKRHIRKQVDLASVCLAALDWWGWGEEGRLTCVESSGLRDSNFCNIGYVRLFG